MQFINGLYTDNNLPVLKDMAMICVLQVVGSYLGDNYMDLQDNMIAAITGSAPARDPMATRALTAVENLMEPTLSNMYASAYGTQKTKDDMKQMVEAIRQKRIDRINALDWMSAQTKTKAVDKLKSITAYVAYPDKPIDELNFDVKAKEDGGSLVDFYMSQCKATAAKGLADLQKPVDQNMWDSVPTYTVNAYYDASVNGIMVPAGILQSPVYNPNGTQEENLGSIGAVIGHELTHSVDNNGALFDKNGTMTNWWIDADFTAFAAKTKAVSDALSQIKFNGQQVNGNLCGAEAIADLGGLSAALSIAQDKNLDTGTVINAWAKLWDERMSQQTATYILSIDVHLPAKIRVNFTVAQQDEFYKAFNIQESDGMYTAPENRVNIW
jgi:putative endopeptidase